MATRMRKGATAERAKLEAEVVAAKQEMERRQIAAAREVEEVVARATAVAKAAEEAAAKAAAVPPFVAAQSSPSRRTSVSGSSLPPELQYHFFISYTQRNGMGKVLSAELYHEMENHGKVCWLDVKMPKQDMDAMKEGVEKSACVLAIVTGGDVFDSRYFEREMCLQ